MRKENGYEQSLKYQKKNIYKFLAKLKKNGCKLNLNLI